MPCLELRTPNPELRKPRTPNSKLPFLLQADRNGPGMLLTRRGPFGVAFALGWTTLGRPGTTQGANLIQPDTVVFRDDGVIPNSHNPFLLYHRVLDVQGDDPAARVQERFASCNWTNSWINAIYTFHHYHSTSHEVLGVYRGSATVRLGGEQGQNFTVQAGDVIVIPAGVGHKNLGSSDDFGVVGAYPDGRQWDLLTGRPGERPMADRNIVALPIPATDPVYGPKGPLRTLWAGGAESATEG
jgi:uncharacterized protein YjlB